MLIFLRSRGCGHFLGQAKQPLQENVRTLPSFYEKWVREKGFTFNIRVKPFYIVKVSSSVSRSLIRFNR